MPDDQVLEEVFPTPTTTWWSYDLDEDSDNFNEGADCTEVIRRLVAERDALRAELNRVTPYLAVHRACGYSMRSVSQ